MRVHDKTVRARKQQRALLWQRSRTRLVRWNIVEHPSVPFRGGPTSRTSPRPGPGATRERPSQRPAGASTPSCSRTNESSRLTLLPPTLLLSPRLNHLAGLRRRTRRHCRRRDSFLARRRCRKQNQSLRPRRRRSRRRRRRCSRCRRSRNRLLLRSRRPSCRWYHRRHGNGRRVVGVVRQPR